MANEKQNPSLKILRVINGPVVSDGSLLRMVELTDGSGRVEQWNGKTWIPGGGDVYAVMTGIPATEAHLVRFGVPVEPTAIPKKPFAEMTAAEREEQGNRLINAFVAGLNEATLAEEERRTQLGPRFEAALAYAAKLHADQRRKGTAVPYVAHLLGVCAIALEHGADEDEAIGALLHDAAEDQGGQTTLNEILRRFGNRVAGIVEGCTDAWSDPKPPWRARKEAYLKHLPQASPSVRLVSASDKLYNAQAILTDYRQLGPALWERFKGGKDGTLWYYQSLSEIFSELAVSYYDKQLAAELKDVVQELVRAVNETETLRA